MIIFFKYFPILILFSCAAALVPETNDPNVKLKQSYELVSSKRGIAAEKVIDQAVSMFEARGDQEGLARCHYAYALLYRSDASHHNLSLPDNYRAGVEYKKAANIYHQLKNPKYEAETLILAAIFYGIGNKVGKMSLTCRTLSEAQKIASSQSIDLRSRVELHLRKMNCI